MRKGWLKGILPGAAAGIIFVLFLFLLNFGLPISILAGVAVYAGLALLTSGAPGASRTVKDMVSDATKEARAKIALIQNRALNIRQPRIRQDLSDILKIVRDIVQDYEKKPLETASFTNMNYYLDSLINIVNKYIELTGEEMKTEQVENVLAKVEDAIQSFKETLMKERGKILENDIYDLEAEINVLNKTIRTEGLQ